ncbi:MAG TPA: tryptophan synthase subunit alpha [Rhizomicrobium sp.]
MSRISQRFAALRNVNRAAFVPFITAGDPDPATCFEILRRLPAAGADVIELGVPFSDPMADGPAIQASSLRALNAGATPGNVLEMVRAFRKFDRETPLVLMGYYNPIHAYGAGHFVEEAAGAGVDGLITVDLPPEEDAILRSPAIAHELDIIRLATPTTDDSRLSTILDGATGFLYYVSVAGVTGTKSHSGQDVKRALARIRTHTRIPVAVGFGIKSPDQAGEIARFADGVVVGSAIVSRIGQSQGSPVIDDVLQFCGTLAESVHAARDRAVLE